MIKSGECNHPLARPLTINGNSIMNYEFLWCHIVVLLCFTLLYYLVAWGNMPNIPCLENFEFLSVPW